jgi:hypothetical protein
MAMSIAPSSLCGVASASCDRRQKPVIIGSAVVPRCDPSNGPSAVEGEAAVPCTHRPFVLMTQTRPRAGRP